jgi:hypothetical protein
MAPSYWRVTFLAANGKRRHVWAKNYNDPGAGRCITFTVVDKNGDEGDPKREVVFAAPNDVLRLRRARLSNMYAELETY